MLGRFVTLGFLDDELVDHKVGEYVAVHAMSRRRIEFATKLTARHVDQCHDIHHQVGGNDDIECLEIDRIFQDDWIGIRIKLYARIELLQFWQSCLRTVLTDLSLINKKLRDLELSMFQCLQARGSSQFQLPTLLFR